MCAALVLGVRSQPDEVEWKHLTGHTSKGQQARLVFVDDRLTRIDIRPSGFCRPHLRWVSWRWYRIDGLRVEFEQEGTSFRVSDRGQQTESRWVAELRGELVDDGRAATGTVYTRWGNDDAACEGRVRFSAG